MRRFRLIGVIAGLLLAMMVMAGGAYAHGPGGHAPQGAQTGKTDISTNDFLPPKGGEAAAWISAADHHAASSDCSGDANGECCSHHCCTGTPAAAETRSPTPVTGARPAQVPPDSPRDQTLSGLLRPPCR